MDPRPRTLCDRCSRPASVAIKLIATRTGVEAIAVEAGRNLTLHQGLGHRTGSQRTGSSTHALVEQVCSRSNMLHHVGRGALVATPIFTSPVFARRWSSSALLYNHASFAMLRSVSPAAYPSPNPDLTLACATSRAHDECAHFCLWTGWASQKASISPFLSCPMHGATVAALILIACSSVVESADMRLLEQGRGGQKAACSWLERWLGPSDGFAPRDACSGFSTAHLAMLQ